MSISLPNWVRSLAARAVQAVGVMCVASAGVCHAQFIDVTCMPVNSLQIQDQGSVTIWPNVWAPGHSYTVSMHGTYPINGDCPNIGISAWEWPAYPDYYNTGPADPYINLSNFTQVSPTLTTFDVSVSGDAPTGYVFFELKGHSTAFTYEDFFGVSIQPPPPPNAPSPPPAPPCPTPALDTNSPVTPDTWTPGKTYQITVKGTGFTTAANATTNCLATTITVGVGTGSVDLSNIVVVDSTTITATVTPADTDPNETVNIMLWGPPEFDDDDDDDQAPPATAPQASAPTGAVSQAQDKAMPRSSVASPMSINIPAAPNGMLLDGQATAQIQILKAVIADTSKIINGIVTMKLTAPNGTNGDLELPLSGSSPTLGELNYEGLFSNLSPGTHDLKLPFDAVRPGKYTTASGSDGIWRAVVPGAPSQQSVNVPEYTLPVPWTYFRRVRFSQYNTPYESYCTQDTKTAYIVSASLTSDPNGKKSYTCSFTPIELRSDFIQQTWINGTGVTEDHGILSDGLAVPSGTILKNAAAGPQKLGSGKGQICSGQYPAYAIGVGPKGNTFSIVTSITGSCGPLVDHVSAAMPTLNGAPVQLSGVTILSCNYNLNLDYGTYTTSGVRTIADSCPACGDPAQNGPKNDGHIDSYTNAKGCTAHGDLLDLTTVPVYTSKSIR